MTRACLLENTLYAAETLHAYIHDLLRVGPAALKAGSDGSFTAVNSASSPAFALHDSSSQDRTGSQAKRKQEKGRL
ncbi:hypothetical protein D3C80_1040550 [compost metagenome]